MTWKACYEYFIVFYAMKVHDMNSREFSYSKKLFITYKDIHIQQIYFHMITTCSHTFVPYGAS